MKRTLGKIITEVECPKCKTVLDFSHVKNAIKERLDVELDYILEKI